MELDKVKQMPLTHSQLWHTSRLLALALLLTLAPGCSSSQTSAQRTTLADLLHEDISQTIINPDTLHLWAIDIDEQGKAFIAEEWEAPRAQELGYIGDDFRRFRIHFTEVTKAGADYRVQGYAAILDTVYCIEGVINLDSVVVGDSEEYQDPKGIQEQGSIYASYRFVTTFCRRGNVGVGDTLRGSVLYFYVKTNGKYIYDGSGCWSDDFCNNQYEGVWVRKGGKGQRVCNWGDYRIPNSRELDIGAGCFSPDDRFKGWENYTRIEDDSLLWECDRNWWNRHYELDWDYERLLEQAYGKLTHGGSLSPDELLHLLPTNKEQLWQYYADAHIIEVNGANYSDRLEKIDGAMMQYLFGETPLTTDDTAATNLHTKLIYRYISQRPWTDGWVAEAVSNVTYRLLQKYLDIVKPELLRLGWYDSLIEFEEQ